MIEYYEQLSQEEKRQNQDIDYMSGLFGEIMGEIMAVKADEWQDSLRSMGNFLGKFIYLMDAYEDIEDDIKEHRYNPLIKKFDDPDFEEEVKTILTMMMAGCCKEFECGNSSKYFVFRYLVPIRDGTSAKREKAGRR